MTDKLKELVAQWPHEYYDRKGRRHDALIPETSWVHADELCRRCLVEAILAEQAPAGEFDAQTLVDKLAQWRSLYSLDYIRKHFVIWNHEGEAEGIIDAYAAGRSSQPAVEFDARAWLRKAFPDVREGFFNEIQDIIEAAYAAGRASHPAGPRDPAGK